MIPLADDNPTRSTPLITYILIASCVVVFLWQLSLGQNVQAAIYALGVIPASLLQGAMLPQELRWVSPEITVVTSMFLHGGSMHLIDETNGFMGSTAIVANTIPVGVGLGFSQKYKKKKIFEFYLHWRCNYRDRSIL